LGGLFCAAVLLGNSLNLWPLALVYLLVLCLPQFVCGWLGSRLARRRPAL